MICFDTVNGVEAGAYRGHKLVPAPHGDGRVSEQEEGLVPLPQDEVGGTLFVLCVICYENV